MPLAVDESVRPEDLLAVKSRISWSAILAGAVLALAIYFLLTILGGAVGLSVGDKVTAKTLTIGAIVFTILVTSLALFFGGYMASLFTVGENPREGTFYGILVWATLLSALMFLAASGVRVGYGALIGLSSATEAVPQEQWEDLARKAGIPQERLDDLKAKAQNAPAAAKQAAEDPANQKAVADGAARVAWYTFAGVWLSMLVAALGGYVGSGANIRFLGLGRPATTVTVRRV